MKKRRSKKKERVGDRNQVGEGTRVGGVENGGSGGKAEKKEEKREEEFPKGEATGVKVRRRDEWNTVIKAQ